MPVEETPKKQEEKLNQLHKDIVSLSKMAQINLSAAEIEILMEQIIQSKHSIEMLKELIHIDDTSELIFQVES